MLRGLVIFFSLPGALNHSEDERADGDEQNDLNDRHIDNEIHGNLPPSGKSMRLSISHLPQRVCDADRESRSEASWLMVA